MIVPHINRRFSPGLVVRAQCLTSPHRRAAPQLSQVFGL